MANIYNLSREYNELFELALTNADEETGELNEHIAALMDIKREEIQTKAVSIACVVKRLNSTADEISAEIDRLTKMKKSIEKTTERLKYGLKEAFDKCGIVKAESVHANIFFRPSEQVIIDNEADIPGIYKYSYTQIKVDKIAIKKAIKNGEPVEGAHIEQLQNIQIR